MTETEFLNARLTEEEISESREEIDKSNQEIKEKLESLAIEPSERLRNTLDHGREILRSRLKRLGIEKDVPKVLLIPEDKKEELSKIFKGKEQSHGLDEDIDAYGWGGEASPFIIVTPNMPIMKCHIL